MKKKASTKISEDIIVTTQNITITVQGQKDLWTTTVSAAVLIP